MTNPSLLGTASEVAAALRRRRAIPKRPCPTCGNPAPQAFDVSPLAGVDYLQCKQCYTEWHVPKGFTGPITVISEAT